MTIHVKLIQPITTHGIRKDDHLSSMKLDDLKVTAKGNDIGPNKIEKQCQQMPSESLGQKPNVNIGANPVKEEQEPQCEEDSMNACSFRSVHSKMQEAHGGPRVECPTGCVNYGSRV